jgi:hypothetical protein
LKALRKAAADFHKEFSKLETTTNAQEFVNVLNGLPIRSELGGVNLKGDYDVE